MNEEAESVRGSVRLDPIGKLFADAWQLYKKHFAVLVGILAVPYVINLAAQILYLQKTPILYFGVALSVAGFIFSIVSYIAVIFPFSEGASVSDSYRKGIDLFWPIVWLGVLMYLIFIGGFVMLVVPAMMMSIWFSFAFFIFAIEQRRGLNVLIQSREYVRGYWWAIFGRGLLLSLCTTPILAIAFLALHLFGLMGWLITAFIFGILVYPFMISYFYAIYQNLTVLKSSLTPSAQTSATQKFLKVAGIVGVAAVAGLICLVAFLMHLSASQTASPSNQPLYGADLDNAIVYDLQQHASPVLGMFTAASGTTYWGTQDGYLVPLSGWYQLYSQYFHTMTDTTTTKAADDLTQYAVQRFTENGFKPDPYNISTSTDNGPFYRLRTAFVSADGTIHCVIQSPQHWQYLSQWYLQCALTKDISTVLQQDMPFLNALGNPTGTAIFPVQAGKFANVQEFNEVESFFYTAIMVKKTDGWTVIFKGSQQPPCSLMDQYGVPQSIFESCAFSIQASGTPPTADELRTDLDRTSSSLHYLQNLINSQP